MTPEYVSQLMVDVSNDIRRVCSNHGSPVTYEIDRTRILFTPKNPADITRVKTIAQYRSAVSGIIFKTTVIQHGRVILRIDVDKMTGLIEPQEPIL